MTLKTFLASAAVASLATGAAADDTGTVNAFYDMLSNPSSEEHVAAFVNAIDESWISVGDYSGKDKTGAAFFGVDGQGRSFDIMTIDIHQLEDGKIAKTWHIEDWAGAL